MKRWISILPVTVFCCSLTLAQTPEVMNNWVFGWFAGLNFTTGNPVPFNGTGMMSQEGSISYSDDQGNLLFYSNGGDDGSGNPGYSFGGVWNKNFQLMPNGDITGLTGCNSSPQSALIIPKSPTEYYMFTIGCAGLPMGLRKSVIDMTLDGGLGDLSLVGEILLNNATFPLAEGLTGTRHANGTDYWIVVHSKTGNKFYTILVSPFGVSTAMIQPIGATGSNIGQLRFNLQGTKLAFNGEIFDFDNATGLISNPVDIGQTGGWGRAFSASGRYFYLNGAGALYQFDMEAPNIAASKVILYNDPTHLLGGMQIGPDLKIYMAEFGLQGLDVINQPDQPGVACNFAQGGLMFGFGSSQMSLPNYIDGDLLSLLEMKENQFKLTFSVYPNPSRDLVVINGLPENADIQVYNVQGSEVTNWSMTEGKMDISKLEVGIYFIQVDNVKVKLLKE